MSRKLVISEKAIEAIYSGIYTLDRPLQCRAETGEELSLAWCEEGPIGRVGLHSSFTREEAEFSIQLGIAKWFSAATS